MHRVFKGLHHLAGQRGQAREDIDRSLLNAVFVDEGDVAIPHLDRDRHQHGIAGDFHEVGSHVERHRVEDHLGVNLFGEVRELNLRSGLQLGELLQAVELLGLQRRTVRAKTQALQPVGAREARRLVRHAHLLVECQARVRGIEQGILFGAVHGHVEFVAHAGVDEFDDDFLADPVDVAVPPVFKRKRRGLAAAFFYGALVGSTRGMGVDLIGLAVHDVNPAAIRSPAGHSRREMLVGIGDALVVLFFIFVFFGVRSGVAALPERFNKVVAFFVVRELFEGRAFFVGNDPDHVLFEPLLVGLGQLVLERLLIPLFLLFRGRTLERIYGIGRLSLGSGRAGLARRRLRPERACSGPDSPGPAGLGPVGPERERRRPTDLQIRAEFAKRLDTK